MVELTDPREKLRTAIGMGAVFHAKNGWRFARLADGAVGIMGPGEDTFVVLDNYTWCSVICSVSHRSETPESWREARLFHDGGEEGRS